MHYQYGKIIVVLGYEGRLSAGEMEAVQSNIPLKGVSLPAPYHRSPVFSLFFTGGRLSRTPPPHPPLAASRAPPRSPVTPLRLPLRPPGTTRALSRPVLDGGGSRFSEGRAIHAYRT